MVLFDFTYCRFLTTSVEGVPSVDEGGFAGTLQMEYYWERGRMKRHRSSGRHSSLIGWRGGYMLLELQRGVANGWGQLRSAVGAVLCCARGSEGLWGCKRRLCRGGMKRAVRGCERAATALVQLCNGRISGAALVSAHRRLLASANPLQDQPCKTKPARSHQPGTSKPSQHHSMGSRRASLCGELGVGALFDVSHITARHAPLSC